MPSEQPPTAPAYPIGYPVVINGYVGIVRADEQENPRFHRKCRVAGVRLLHQARENDDGTFSMTYPEGWEYLLIDAEKNPEKWWEWGWESEADLRAAGYLTPAEQAARMRDPNYIPTVDEALADPAGFVAGMTEYIQVGGRLVPKTA